MSKAVLISIRPKWCEGILTGRKTVDVRRTKPKLPPPFKTYIYCTGGETLYRSSNDGEYRLTKLRSDARPLSHHTVLNGMVIAEFICDWCDPFPPERGPFAELALSSLVPPRELYEYAGGKTLYGWHISELKAYAEPLPLHVFRQYGECSGANGSGRCGKCPYFEPGVPAAELEDDCLFYYDRSAWGMAPVLKAPQSWMCVEELPHA